MRTSPRLATVMRVTKVKTVIITAGFNCNPIYFGFTYRQAVLYTYIYIYIYIYTVMQIFTIVRVKRRLQLGLTR